MPLCLFLAWTSLSAQNLLITTQNPDALAVCGSDTLSVSLLNSQSATIANLTATVVLPSGISYISGSVQGALENNITVPNQPVFGLQDLPGGTTGTFTIQVRADCGLVEAINSGQLFVNQIVAQYAGGAEQASSLAYPVETGLLLILSVTPAVLSGEFGQTLSREIRFRNTRLGQIGRIRLTDTHAAGFTVATPGAANQSNVSPTFFEANFDGNFLSAFGDGDAWLEFNEEGVITQEITINDCGLPPFDSPSEIRLAWGCDTTICRYDTAEAVVSILPSTQNPNLSFIPKYSPPRSFCGDFPAIQEIRVVNTGSLPATNVVLDVYSGSQDLSGFLPGSFAYKKSTGDWTPLNPNLVNTGTLLSCGQTAAWRVLVTLPEVPANDTVALRMEAVTCAEECAFVVPPYYFYTLYRKACPANFPVSDSLGLAPDSLVLEMKAYPVYQIGDCLLEGESYPVGYQVESPALLTDTGFLQIRLTLPKGIYWDYGCTPQIAGNAAVSVTQTDIGDDIRQIVTVFQLPFQQDSVVMDFCLEYLCQPDMNCIDAFSDWDPEGVSVTEYFGLCARPCGLELSGLAVFTPTADADPACGFSICDEFILFVDNFCNDDGSGSGNGGGDGGGGVPFVFDSLRISYDVYRTNLGLDDSNDDRAADSAGPPTDLQLIRRDRYLSGDTLRFDLRGVVVNGPISQAPIQIFTEIIESETGLAGGDLFSVINGQSLFTHRDSTALIGARLKIRKATGEISACDVLPILKPHQRFIQLKPINVEPSPVIDKLISMNHQFQLPFTNCSPDGEPLQAGDSLFLEADFHFVHNFIPPALVLPPLVNFRTTLWWGEYAWTYPDQVFIPGKLGQYSGYYEKHKAPEQTIRPCATSFQIAPFFYQIRIARENMFPFELRPLARLSDVAYRVPAEVSLESAKAAVSLQENTPWLSGAVLPFALMDSAYHFNYGGVFSNPIDEGFQIQTDFVFEPSCTFVGPDTAHFNFNVNLLIDCPPGQVLNYAQTNPTGFFDGLPQPQIESSDSVVLMPAPSLTLDLFIKNNRPAQAPNAWVYIEPLNGSLSQIEVLRLPQQQALPGANGFFQLGTLGTFSNTFLHLRARNTNCAPLQVLLISGWGCDPGAGPQAHSCGRDTALVELRLLNAVLEINPLSQPDNLPLCEPSDWFVVEILNANDGNALQLLQSVQLPQGIRVQPGTTQVSYPAGSGWTNAADPQVLPGNVYQWKLEDLLPALALDGLPGFQNAPANAFRIRFRAIADCGFVANAQPVYGVDGRQPCGTATNRLRKPGDPVGLLGVGQPYSVDIQLDTPGGNDSLFCGEQMEVAVQLQIQGTPSPNDSVYLQLPTGVSYVPASYAPGQNAPAGPPQITGQTIQLPLPAGLGANAVVRFNLRLAYNETAGCADQLLIAQTRLKVSGFCAAIGQLCDVYLATGEALLPLPVQNPDIVRSGFTGTITGGVMQLKVQLLNAGPAPAPGATVFVVFDQNGNGLADPADPIVQTLQNTAPLLPGNALELSAPINILPEQRCRLLLVIPAAENCACQPKVYPLDTWIIQQTPTALCTVVPVAVGIDSLPGADYAWTPAGLTDCDTCSRTVFRPGSNTQPGDIFTLTLTETAAGCVLEHTFEVRFGATPSILSPDQTICQGDTATLEATAGGVYQWAGPGIVQPGSQKQRVSPSASALYTVTITAADGCTGTDSVSVSVLENRTADLGVFRTCPGVPIALLGVLTDQPGLYTQTYAAANGCDSVVTARLELFDADGQSEVALCTGDSIRVFDTLLTSAGTVCRQFVSSAGCDSLHCVAVSLLPSVQINSPDSVIVLLGDSIQLQGPPGFDTYRWEPATWLSCADCPSPWAVPLADTAYTLTVGNASGCTAQASYRVIVYPPCDPKRLLIPNAITPDGDGKNDVFRVVPFEGFELVREMRIYDRWGKEVYRGAGNAAWDGLVDGQPGVSDTYIYVLTILCDEKEEKIVGDVTVIR